MAESGGFSSGSLPTQFTAPYGNTENSLPLPQGSQTPYALPSSISSMITGLLYDSRAKPTNYWQQFFSGSTTPAPYSPPSTSPIPTTQPPSSSTSTTTSNKYATGGTIKLSSGKYYTVLGLASAVPSGYGGQTTYTHTGSDGKKYRIALGPNSGKTSVTAPSSGTTTPTLPGYQGTGGTTPLPNTYQYANPMQGYTMQALQIADSYFSPKRLELAYELEQMDTDMRRLAVNLGRQIDDPILQAKLYKEAMKQTRQLDNDQSVFALQMVEQRRKEEMANRQFYDSLSLEADKVKAASQQFFASLNLSRGQTELANQQFYASLALQQQLIQAQIAAQQGNYGGGTTTPPPAAPATGS